MSAIVTANIRAPTAAAVAAVPVVAIDPAVQPVAAVATSLARIDHRAAAVASVIVIVTDAAVTRAARSDPDAVAAAAVRRPAAAARLRRRNPATRVRTGEETSK